MTSISVIIPTYNVAEYIEEGLLSVLGQTCPAHEIICVDDGSTDDTVKIIKNLQLKYPDKILLFINETNRGATYTRNKGLAIATGEYIQFFDADDLLLPAKFETQIKIIEKTIVRPDILVNDFFRRTIDGKEEVYNYVEQDVWCAVMETALGVTSGNLYKRAAVLAVNGWTEDLKSSQEYDLMFRMLTKGSSVKFDGNCLSIIRERPAGSISKSNPGERWQRYIHVRIRIFNYLTENNMVTKDRHQCFINILFDAIRILYKYDSDAALKLHKQYILAYGQPKPSLITSKRYLSIYNLFGFKIAEFASKIINPNTAAVH
ncbi:MAG: glycosyltransferase family 2 protein [Bacteroidetes bacterium]|nr:glycosyltransferase family 2 protein [Bacteroidota bacterium]